MKASVIEFRLRWVIMVAIVVLGFWSPWTEAWSLGARGSLFESLSLQVSRLGLLRFTYATPAVIILGTLIAALGAVLRVWGAAYLGYGIVHHAEMQAGAVMTDGPYRYVRNPLYIGTWCMMAAMSFVMPATGALFSMTLLTVFLLRLILCEEAFLSGQLGEPYGEYLHEVPRLFPRLRGGLPAAGHKPHWMIALLTELNPIGVFITMAFLSWSYDNVLMLKGILISLGASLVVRALMPREHASPDPV
ncbi:MAG TPA: isoprenylcysteine carboxylmethyltransferase family protein [Terracidiphilus sp.]|nr:isoprenylcysteine carboxylmethyltransferase family protein [Terracidiphilus sp.]